MGMKLSEELQWRGFLNQTTLEDITKLDTEKRTFYMGFDASSDSQAVGNLAAMMFIWTFIRHGHDPIILTGGSTSLVGDPGGKTEERQLQAVETIAYNTECARKQIEKILGGQKFRTVNNLDWTKDVNLLDFLRNIGKNFSITNMIQRDFVADRIGEGGAGLSYAEFSYALLQAYDYLHLFDTYGCTLQLGGSDQWGNCLSGVELIRKTRGAEVDVVTLSLVIDKTTGRKFGKSEGGAVWLDELKTSPFKFYQFWLNVGDTDAIDYLKIYTILEKEEVDALEEEMKTNAASRPAQKRLAYEVTKIVHGDGRAMSVRRISEALFGATGYDELNKNDFKELESELLTINVSEGSELIDFLVASELAGSRGDARRFLESSAIYINGSQLPLGQGDFLDHDFKQGYAVVRRGKNSIALAKLV
jgi:tyrosyl-tRNA synthetase